MDTNANAAPVAGKWWWHSKTVLLNGAVAVLGSVAVAVDVAQANLPVLQSILPEPRYAGLLTGLAVANMALRVATSMGISWTRPTPPAP
ncbi:hypothetical protein [Ideonella sp.]|uniref:hypothetical protein n=1 Tax=Ideonella sp. TaxID=1929293 RepID=UPI003BB786B1